VAQLGQRVVIQPQLAGYTGEVGCAGQRHFAGAEAAAGGAGVAGRNNAPFWPQPASSRQAPESPRASQRRTKLLRHTDEHMQRIL